MCGSITSPASSHISILHLTCISVSILLARPIVVTLPFFVRFHWIHAGHPDVKRVSSNYFKAIIIKFFELGVYTRVLIRQVAPEACPIWPFLRRVKIPQLFSDRLLTFIQLFLDCCRQITLIFCLRLTLGSHAQVFAFKVFGFTLTSDTNDPRNTNGDKVLQKLV